MTEGVCIMASMKEDREDVDLTQQVKELKKKVDEAEGETSIVKTGKLEDLSEEELELKMKKILDDYAPILNAKQVEALPEEITEIPESKDKSKK